MTRLSSFLTGEAPNELHIWICQNNILSQSTLKRYLEVMNPEERAQQTRFIHEKDRLRYLVTRGLVRHTLTRYITSVRAEDWRFEKNEFGKPGISSEHGFDGLHFNVSHSGNFVVLVVAYKTALGVDVELVNRQTSSQALAEYAFSSCEVTELLARENVAFEKRFFEYWTLKESYIKAEGKGLSIPLNSFDFNLLQEKIILFNFNEMDEEMAQRLNIDRSNKWNFWQFSIDEQPKQDDYLLALAVSSRRPARDFRICGHRLLSDGGFIEEALQLNRHSDT